MTIKLQLCFALFLFPLCVFAQLFHFKKDYKPGYYIDKSGKVEGYIHFSEMDYEEFLFKKEKDGKRVKKRVESCDGFEFDGRRFTVITNIEMKIGIWNVGASRAFAEIIVEGAVTVYKVYASVGNGNPSAPGVNQVENLFLEKRESKKYEYVSFNKKKFKEMASLIFADNPEILVKIESGEFKRDDIMEIVRIYNASTTN